LSIEAAAGVADEAEGLLVVKAEKNGAEGDAAIARGGPTADDGVKRLRDFDFGPTGAAVADVTAVDAFGDDAFEALGFGEVEELFAKFDLVIGEAEGLGGMQKTLEDHQIEFGKELFDLAKTQGL